MTTNANRIVSAFFAAFGARDLSAATEFFTDDVVYTVIGDPSGEVALDSGSIAAIPWLGRYDGVEGVHRFLAHLQANIDIVGFGPQTIIAQGNNVAVFGTFSYIARSTRRRFDSNYAIRIKLRGEKICEYFFHENTFAVAAAFRTSGHWTMALDGSSYQLPAHI